MTEKEREIKETEENSSAVSGNRLDRAVTEEKEGGNAEGGNDQGPRKQPVLQVKAGDQSGADRGGKVVFQATCRREGHTIKFIEGDKDGDGDGQTEKGRRGTPHQQNEEREEDDPGNNPLFNNISP
jgi:hypothetical protein